MATYPSLNIFGNQPFFCPDVMLGRKSPTDIALNQYKAMVGEKVYGTYTMGRPNLIIRDPELVKSVLVKDFHHFVDRQSERSKKLLNDDFESDRVWGRNMTVLSGEFNKIKLSH